MGSSPVVHFQCCDGWLSESARRPARPGPGTEPAPAGGRAGLLPIRGRLVARAGPGRARARLALGDAGRAGPGRARLALGAAGWATPGPGPRSGVSTSGGDGGCGASPIPSSPFGSLRRLSFCACVCAVSSSTRGSLGALLRRVASAAPGPRPFFLLRAVVLARTESRLPASTPAGASVCD